MFSEYVTTSRRSPLATRPRLADLPDVQVKREVPRPGHRREPLDRDDIRYVHQHVLSVAAHRHVFLGDRHVVLRGTGEHVLHHFLVGGFTPLL